MNYEELRSNEQFLTFENAKKAFDKYKIEFSDEKYLNLGLIFPKDKIYTNLALLISDQCKHSIKVAVFGDIEKTKFKDTREFEGSIFNQLEETFNYLEFCNNTSATFNGLERIEKKDYPVEAIRESLLNAIIHRDYSYSGSIIINLTEKEIEFISIGGLLPNLTSDDIRSGISQPRNKKLAEIFHRLHLVEAYGTGIRKIFELYKNNRSQPNIQLTPNTFKIILPNMNYSD